MRRVGAFERGFGGVVWGGDDVEGKGRGRPMERGLRGYVSAETSIS